MKLNTVLSLLLLVCACSGYAMEEETIEEETEKTPLLPNEKRHYYGFSLDVESGTKSYANTKPVIEVKSEILEMLLAEVRKTYKESRFTWRNEKSPVTVLEEECQHKKGKMLVSPDFVVKCLMTYLYRVVEKDCLGDSEFAQYAASHNVDPIVLNEEISVRVNGNCLKLSGALAGCMNGFRYLDRLYKGIVPQDHHSYIYLFYFTLGFGKKRRIWNWDVVRSYVEKDKSIIEKISRAMEMCHDPQLELIRKKLGQSNEQTKSINSEQED